MDSAKKQQAASPHGLQLQHLLRAADLHTQSPALGAMLGRRVLEVAATGGQGLPRGTLRPCQRCGAFTAHAQSDVRRLSRGAMRRQQRQQQQRAKPAGNGLPNRWLAADTCSLCGHDTKRLMQRDPGQRQGQAGQQQAKQPQAAQSSQQQAAAGQADTVVPALPASSDMPPAQAPTEADIAGTAMQHGAAPPLPIDQQQGGHLVGVQRQEQQQRQGQQGQQPLLLQQQKEEQVLQAAPLQLVAAAQSLGTEDVAGHRVGGFLKVADTQLPAASDGQQSVEDGEMGSGEEAAAVPHGSCSGESPPEKRRRLSWSDQLQAVRLIDRAPRPQPKKLVSWHRLARSWKAAKLSLAHGGGGGRGVVDGGLTGCSRAAPPALNDP